MTDEKRYTEREVVLRERAAFRAGATTPLVFYPTDNDLKRRYPLPVCMRGVRVTLSDGSTAWREGEKFAWTAKADPEKVELDLVASLLPENPTAEDFRQIARLLDREQEPVPENET